MSEVQLKAFIEKVKADTSLQEMLKAVADVDAILAIAKEADFTISPDDLKQAQSEISEEELESATGGRGGSCGRICFRRGIVSCFCQHQQLQANEPDPSDQQIGFLKDLNGNKSD